MLILGDRHFDKILFKSLNPQSMKEASPSKNHVKKWRGNWGYLAWERKPHRDTQALWNGLKALSGKRRSNLFLQKPPRGHQGKQNSMVLEWNQGGTDVGWIQACHSPGTLYNLHELLSGCDSGIYTVGFGENRMWLCMQMDSVKTMKGAHGCKLV